MIKIAATYIFPGNRPPLKNGILICENDGKIVEVVDTGGKISEQENLEYYSGILVPGFINAHCHLELSFLKNKIAEKKGIGNFIGEINRLRNIETEKAEPEMQKADRRMWASGIAAVGDISNSALSLETKKNSKIYYHTFVEAFGFHPARAERAIDLAQFVLRRFRKNGLNASLVPHSAYSVSQPLFEKIRKIAALKTAFYLFTTRKAMQKNSFTLMAPDQLPTTFSKILNIDISHWKPTGKSSLVSVLSFLPQENPLLLVHNTFTEKPDIDELKKYRHLENTFFVLCPNSNLYIENHLPPVELFREEKLNICLGTDSLASNHNLSVLEEMKALQLYFPEIELEELIAGDVLMVHSALGINDKFRHF